LNLRSPEVKAGLLTTTPCSVMDEKGANVLFCYGTQVLSVQSI
jgi:hypothetical protein